MPHTLSSPSLLLLVSCLGAAAVACSSSDETAGPGGSSAGKSGSPSTGGQGGSSGGTTGAGTGGKAGQGGTAAGQGGATGGQGGKAGQGGAGGATAGVGGATAGSSGVAGKAGGGAGTSGQGGKAGVGGAPQGGQGGQAGQVSGGQGGSAGKKDPGPAVGLAVTPSQGEILWVDGVAAPLQLEAHPIYQDQSMGPAVSDALWQVNFGDIAQVTSTGVLTATGQRAGDVTVTASWQGLQAQAAITVKFQITLDTAGLPDASRVQLGSATQPDPALSWNYPYNGTVFPRGLAAPKMMWNGANVGDEMMVRMSNKWLTLDLFFASLGQDFTLPQGIWEKVTEAGTGGPLSVRVSRLSGGNATLMMDHTWKVANGSLRGTVYYWSNNLGRVLRIKPGADAPDDFLKDTVPGCTTCHAVSANGSTMILGGDVETSTYDLINNQPVFSTNTVGKPVRNWAMPAISPSGNFLIENGEQAIPGPPGASLGFWDTHNGSNIADPNLSAPLDMPAFSPNGTRLAFIDHSTKGLARFDYSEANNVPSLSNRVDLLPVPAGFSEERAFLFPSMSPDAAQIVYHRGAIDTRFGFGDLYLADANNPGSEYPLDALNGISYPFSAGDRDRHYNYEPTFMPVAAGGYYWVVFTSRRTYGNQLTGGKDAVKQIWVAAIDENLQPGQDPSHPAFWVPGQDPNTLNMRAFWALDPCKQDGVGCSKGSECCSTSCDAASNTCGPPPGQTCQPVGQSCSSASDCCFASEGYQCLGGFCTEPKP